MLAAESATYLSPSATLRLASPEVSAPLPLAASPPAACVVPQAMEPRASVYTSEELLQGQREAWIEHRGELYRLRLTSAGKLYLTK
jgi:hemin uptake protein HemP